MNCELRPAIVLVCLLLTACWPESEWTDLRGSASDCLVVVFPSGTTIQEVNGFLESHTHGTPHPGGGFRHRSSIGAVINTSIDGKMAYEICFKPDADPAEANTIREGIKASPLVERVLEGEGAERAAYGKGR